MGDRFMAMSTHLGRSTGVGFPTAYANILSVFKLIGRVLNRFRMRRDRCVTGQK